MSFLDSINYLSKKYLKPYKYIQSKTQMEQAQPFLNEEPLDKRIEEPLVGLVMGDENFKIESEEAERQPPCSIKNCLCLNGNPVPNCDQLTGMKNKRDEGRIKFLPLIGMDIHVEIHDSLATIKMVQEYLNPCS